MGTIREKLQKRWQQHLAEQKQKRIEKRELEKEIKRKEKAAYNEAYMSSRVEVARRQGREAGKRKQGIGGTLQRIGKGFEGTFNEMYPEYSGKRKKGKKRKRNSLDELLGF